MITPSDKQILSTVRVYLGAMPILSGDSEKVTLRMADYRALQRIADGEDPRTWVSVPCGMAYGTEADGSPHRIDHGPHHWTDPERVDHWCDGTVD